ncbi:hypothetical protein FHG87_017187 [Trinorchestia longiramus]|nr:hypothetical protein FHG87_017187 [Trinorchestia longiramus]
MEHEQRCNATNVPRIGMFYDGSFSSQLLFAVRCRALSMDMEVEWHTSTFHMEVEWLTSTFHMECSRYEHDRESFMNVVRKQYGENQWNARCVEENLGMIYVAGLDEKYSMTVMDAMKDFLGHAWNKRH